MKHDFYKLTTNFLFLQPCWIQKNLLKSLSTVNGWQPGESPKWMEFLLPRHPVELQG